MPVGTKASSAAALLDSWCALFRGKTVASVGTFYSPRIRRIGQDGDFIQYNIEVDYYRDEVVSA